jgi:hypothetical protein
MEIFIEEVEFVVRDYAVATLSLLEDSFVFGSVECLSYLFYVAQTLFFFIGY